MIIFKLQYCMTQNKCQLYNGNLVYDKVEKRVANTSCITNFLPIFSLLYHTLNFHNKNIKILEY